jgi:hypothetical protein
VISTASSSPHRKVNCWVGSGNNKPASKTNITALGKPVKNDEIEELVRSLLTKTSSKPDGFIAEFYLIKPLKNWHH